jgi:hypothetical protein
MSLLSMSYQYSYMQYTLDMNIEQNHNVFKMSLLLQLLAWGGICYVHMNNLYVVAASILIGTSNLYIMYQDYLYATKQINTPYSISLDHILFSNLVGWLLLSYSIADNESERLPALVIGLVMFGLSTIGLRKERDMLLTDGPSYILLTLAVVFLSYYLADIKPTPVAKPVSTPVAKPVPTPSNEVIFGKEVI